ncbi:hypothetical protein GYMLUDRAFT_83283 [Collybiopsis luxurians FD-317 M1]|nr:hypothetical protein GYMLUDRAFT_83283 [Collybiopsis luxurians FD-317 M1]
MLGMDSTLGALEIGILLSSVLFGVLTAQVYTYQRSFADDSPWIKYGVVATMWLVDLGHTICLFHIVYFYTISHYGERSSLETVPSSLGASIILHGIIIVLVQGYFTYRIQRFSQRLYIPVFSIFLILCQALAIVTLGGELIATATKGLLLVQFVEKWGWLVFTPLALRSISDITITGAMAYYLGTRKKEAYRKTVAVLDKLILWSIETGVVISIMGFSSLILASFSDRVRTLSKTYIWLGLLTIFPKVFSNTMMANINSRINLRKTMATTTENSMMGKLSSHNRAMPVHTNPSNALNIAVHTEVEVEVDAEAAGVPWPTSRSDLNVEMDPQKSNLAIY